jgi:hypothetical protein
LRPLNGVRRLRGGDRRHGEAVGPGESGDVAPAGWGAWRQGGVRGGRFAKVRPGRARGRKIAAYTDLSAKTRAGVLSFGVCAGRRGGDAASRRRRCDRGSGGTSGAWGRSRRPSESDERSAPGDRPLWAAPRPVDVAGRAPAGAGRGRSRGPWSWWSWGPGRGGLGALVVVVSGPCSRWSWGPGGGTLWRVVVLRPRRSSPPPRAPVRGRGAGSGRGRARDGAVPEDVASLVNYLRSKHPA